MHHSTPSCFDQCRLGYSGGDRDPVWVSSTGPRVFWMHPPSPVHPLSPFYVLARSTVFSVCIKGNMVVSRLVISHQDGKGVEVKGGGVYV